MNWELQTVNLVTRRHHQRIRFVSNEKFLTVSVVVKTTADKADVLRISTELAQAQTTVTQAAMGENVRAVSAVVRATGAKTDLFRISTELAQARTTATMEVSDEKVRANSAVVKTTVDQADFLRINTDLAQPHTAAMSVSFLSFVFIFVLSSVLVMSSFGFP
jgi:hypothetical protein